MTLPTGRFEDEASYDVAIPTKLLTDPNIEPGCVRCYGVIKSLTRLKGYCWASNRYLADALSVGERTVKRCIHSLEKEGYLSVEFDLSDNKLVRKLFLGGVRNDLGVGQKSPGGGTKMAPNIDKEVNIYKKNIHTSPLAFGKFVTLQKEEYEELCAKSGKDKVDSVIEDMNDWIAPKGKSPYTDYAAAIRNWLKKDAKDIKESIARYSANEELIKKIRENIPTHPHIEYGSDYIQFNLGNYNCHHIKVKDNGFRDQVINQLRKMGLKIEGL